MIRVILSDSRNDFIKVIIAARKHLTDKQPPPLSHKSSDRCIWGWWGGGCVVFLHKTTQGKTCTLHNVKKESQRRRVASCFSNVSHKKQNDVAWQLYRINVPNTCRNLTGETRLETTCLGSADGENGCSHKEEPAVSHTDTRLLPFPCVSPGDSVSSELATDL